MRFAVFILSHKRADRVETYSTLRNSGYTGEIYVVIDDEDPQQLLYQERFENILVFNKSKWIESTDTVTNDKKKSSPVYARNYIEFKAGEMGYDAYIVMDDDIINLRFRYVENYVAKSQALKSSLDEVLEAYINYLLTANIATLSFATVMVYAGGVHSEADMVRLASHRYTCQIHMRNLAFPVDWISLANNDSISANNTAKLGYLWWALPFIVYDSPKMNTLPGGMKEVYDGVSEFRRAFMSTVVSPSVCRVGCSKDRLAIKRDLKAAYPVIISGRWKK
jgi:hypothetical protein